MNVESAVNRMEIILGFRNDLDQDAHDALKEVQQDYENFEMGFLPYFLKKQVTLTILEGNNWVPLPDDYLADYEHIESAVWIDEVGSLEKVDYFFTEKSLRDAPIGPAYYRAPNRIYINGKATKDVEMQLIYYGRDSILETSGSENNWLKYASKLMIGGAGMKLSGLQDFNANKVFMEMMESGKRALAQQDVANRNFRPQMGRDVYFGEGYQYNDIDFRNFRR